MYILFLVTFLAVFQLLYFIALQGMRGYWIQSIWMKELSLYAIGTPWCNLSRWAIVGLSTFASLERIKYILKQCLSRRFWYVFLLFSWVICSILFIFFGSIFCVHAYQEWSFVVCLSGSLIPVLFKTDALPSYQDASSIKRPSAYNQESAFSISLPTEKRTPLPINNPLRGIYILGSAGSGKTRFVLEPIIYQFIEKGYCGIVYDYDFEGTPLAAEKSYCLSKFSYNCYTKFCDSNKVDFKIINFTDPSRSFRVNPIDPEYISNRAYLEEYVTVLLKNLNPDKKDDFWNLSTKSLLKGIIVFLANRAPSFCTIPHVLTLSSRPIESVLSLIKQDNEAYAYASSIFDAYQGGTQSSSQLIGIIASFKSSLQLLFNKELFWVLSANDIHLSVNNSSNPTILCIGNAPGSKSAFSPVIALLITVCFKSMYGHGRNKSFVLIDELPTLYIPDISELPATARKYGISTVCCVQSNAQLEKTYGSIGSREIQENLSNQFVGNCGVFSAAYGSGLFGKKEQIVHTSSVSTSVRDDPNRRDTTITDNKGLREKERLNPQEFLGMPVGHFSGKVVESDGVFFQEQFKSVSAYDSDFGNKKLKDLPVFHAVSEQDIIDNQHRIYLEIDSLLVEPVNVAPNNDDA